MSTAPADPPTSSSSTASPAAGTSSAPSTPPARRVPLSVLDTSPVSSGGDSAAALRATTTLAQAADEAGYRRFWVAEHHNSPSVASTNPPVLIAHLAASTRRIAVGSGGVMLPNHAPLVVAEQFAMLEALHPGRIDLGLGRAPGTDPRTAAALRRSTDALSVDQFPQHVVELRELLRPSGTGGAAPQDVQTLPVAGQPATPRAFRATPFATSAPSLWLLGSSEYSAHVAGRLGLPYVYAHHFNTGHTMDAVSVYRAEFRPSEQLAEPYLMISASVLVADTEEEADLLAGPSRVWILALRTGAPLAPVVSPEEAAARELGDRERAVLERFPGTQYVGTPATVLPRLRELVDATGADELILTGTAYDVATRVHTLRSIAEHW